MAQAPVVQQRGITLVEVLIALVIVTIVGLFTAVSVIQYVNTRSVMLQDTQKLYLTEAGYEAVRFVRDEDWGTLANLAFDTNHYLAIATSTVSVTSTPEYIAGTYQRMFQVYPLYRDANGQVVEASASGAVEDENGRLVEIYVADENGTTTIEAILTNLHSS